MNTHLFGVRRHLGPAAWMVIACLLMPASLRAQSIDAVGDTALYEREETFYALTAGFPPGWRDLSTFRSQAFPGAVQSGVGDLVAAVRSATSAIAFNSVLDAWGTSTAGTSIQGLTVGDTVAAFRDGDFAAAFSVDSNVWSSVDLNAAVTDLEARGQLAIALVTDDTAAGFSNPTGSWATTAITEGDTIDLAKVVGAVSSSDYLYAYDAAGGSWSPMATSDLTVAAGETLIEFGNGDLQFGAFSPRSAPSFTVQAAGTTPTLLATNPDSRVALYEGSHIGYSSTNDTFTSTLGLFGPVTALTGHKVALLRTGNVTYALSDSIGGDFTNALTFGASLTAVGGRVGLVAGSTVSYAYSSRTGVWQIVLYDSGETYTGHVVGGDIAVVSTQAALYIFNAITGVWTRYPAPDAALMDADGDVAIISNGQRLYGYSASKDLLVQWPVGNATEVIAKGNTAAAFAPSQLSFPGQFAAFSRWTGVWASTPIDDLTDLLVGDNLAIGWNGSEARGFDGYLGLWTPLGLLGILEGRVGRSVGLVRAPATAAGFSVSGAPRVVELEEPAPRTVTPYSSPVNFSWDGDGYSSFDLIVSSQPSPLEGASVTFEVGPSTSFSPDATQWLQILQIVAQTGVGDPIYWTVVGEDARHNPDYGDYWLLFVTDMDPPIPTDPPDNTLADPNSPPIFEWTPEDYAGGEFRLELSTNPEFAPGPGTFFLSPWIPDLLYQPLDDEWANVVALGSGPIYWRVWGRLAGQADRASDVVFRFTFPSSPPSGWLVLSSTYASVLGGKDAELYAFRDQYVKALPGGSALVKGFYANLPWAAALAQRDPLARALGWQLLAPSTAMAQQIVSDAPALLSLNGKP